MVVVYCAWFRASCASVVVSCFLSQCWLFGVCCLLVGLSRWCLLFDARSLLFVVECCCLFVCVCCVWCVVVLCVDVLCVVCFVLRVVRWLLFIVRGSVCLVHRLLCLVSCRSVGCSVCVVC